MYQNNNLNEARKVKNDEFYTQLIDIEKELENYKDNIRGKIVYCNCDNPERSNFWRYFYLNFKELGLKKLIATHYSLEGMVFKQEYDGVSIRKTPLKQNGDFRSLECIEVLKESDVVITNPPFSLFREYIAQLIEHRKEFLVIGNQNSLICKDIFKLIKNNEMWLGINHGAFSFKVPDNNNSKSVVVDLNGNKYVKFGNIAWFTNLKTNKTYKDIPLTESYTEEDYPLYDNYKAINVDRVSKIPKDYYGVIGVPITFMTKYNPNQFEIVDLGRVGSCKFTCNKKMEILDEKGEPTGRFTTNAKGMLYKKYNPKHDKRPAFRNVETGELYSSIYARVLIKRK